MCCVSVFSICIGMFSSRGTRTPGQTSSNRWPSPTHRPSTTFTPLAPLPSPTRPPGRMGAVERSLNRLPPSPHLHPSFHPRPQRSLPRPPTLAHFLHLHLLSRTHPPPLPPPPPPPPLSWSLPSHRCTTHRSTCTPLRTPVRWPWGRGGA